MSTTKKLVYAAATTAIAVAGMAVSRFFPLLSLSPLMLCSLCFYICLECDWRFGLLSIAASLLLGFFLVGFSGAFVLSALIFAPYAVLAKLLKPFSYNNIGYALIRLGLVALMFNALFALIVFALGGFIDELIFSYTLEGLIKSFNNFGYIILSLLGTIFMLCFDFVFLGVSKIVLSKYLRLGGNKPPQ